jgi:hypothetical protein
LTVAGNEAVGVLLNITDPVLSGIDGATRKGGEFGFISGGRIDAHDAILSLEGPRGLAEEERRK